MFFLLIINSSQACDRLKVSGHSRWKLGSYASSSRVTATTLHGQILVCFHRNASLGLCECEKNEWKAGVEKGNIWSSENMSPFEDKYVDVKCITKGCGPVSVEVKEHVQRWRLFFLASGFVLFVLAPILSKWVHFYYTSSVLMGVLFVIIFLIFQGMKLLTAGRNNVVHNLISGSLVIVGVVGFVYVAYILLPVGIILVGAFLGIFTSTLDVPLALICCSTICCLVTCPNWLLDVKRLLHQLIQKTQKLGNGNENGSSQQIYLSTFHKTGPQRRFREQEWEDFTFESTQQALARHFASPEFTAWMVEHAQQIKLFSSDTLDTESTDGNLDSSD
ncbi:hypothetical protein LWI28_009202 [Acer negundo]|uniref:Uncharacterized protein n=1 Tax=Acer negundo TaxID=4023 RepID=A0AAD5P1J0_ACENE|nr:hypothetical protein LWI28_009202 [Acer negundo]